MHCLCIENISWGGGGGNDACLQRFYFNLLFVHEKVTAILHQGLSNMFLYVKNLEKELDMLYPIRKWTKNQS